MRREPHAHGGIAARWMIAGEWRAYPGRIVMAIIAIAVGVGMGFAVHLINASALNEFARAVRTVNGDADLQVHAASLSGFDENLYPKLARTAGVADASPAVELKAVANNAPQAALTLLGLDALRAAQVTPHLVPRPAGARHEDDGDALFLSQAALDALHVRLGGHVALAAAGRSADFFVAGTLPFAGDGQRIGVTDIALAQWRFGMLGHLQRIDLKLDAGADPERLSARLAALLPPDAELVSRDSEARSTDTLSRAYRVNLDMLALMALLSGAFLVYSAQSLSVARRRAQFALLRVLGLSRRALLTQILAEGAILGVAGAALGLGAGLALAYGGLHLLGGDLGGGYFRDTRPDLVFAPGAAAAFLALGIVAALLGSFLPAWEAARAEPAIALKNTGDAVDPRTRPSAKFALGALAAGVGAAFLPAAGGLPLFGYLAIALLLAGGIAAMPFVARALLSPLQNLNLKSPALDLALKRLWGAPSQAAIALCGIVASTSLMIAMAVMVWSFRGSVEDWLTQVLPADVYFHIEGEEGGGVGRDVQQKMAAIAGVGKILFRKQMPLRLAPDKPPIILVAQTIDSAHPEQSLPVIARGPRPPLGAIVVWLSEPASYLYGRRAGETIALPIAGARSRMFFVAGIWRDYARQQGAIAMDENDYTNLTGDVLRSEASVTLAPGADIRTVIAALRASLPPGLAARAVFAEPRTLRAISLRIFDRSFAVTYLLEAIAILVGLTGVAASFSAQILARTKEFGMLRHIGVTRRQIVAMLAAEGAALGTIGIVAGLALGLAIGEVLIHVVNPQSFHWTMETRLPWTLFAVVAAALILSAAGTALLAGRRALSGDAVRAVREDW